MLSRLSGGRKVSTFYMLHYQFLEQKLCFKAAATPLRAKLMVQKIGPEYVKKKDEPVTVRLFWRKERRKFYEERIKQQFIFSNIPIGRV